MARSDIEKALKKGLIIRGFSNVRKAILKNELEKVLVSKNSVKLFNDLKLISINTLIELSEFTSKEQGMLCKKPYAIAVLGIKKR